MYCTEIGMIKVCTGIVSNRKYTFEVIVIIDIENFVMFLMEWDILISFNKLSCDNQSIFYNTRNITFNPN